MFSSAREDRFNGFSEFKSTSSKCFNTKCGAKSFDTKSPKNQVISTSLDFWTPWSWQVGLSGNGCSGSFAERLSNRGDFTFQGPGVVSFRPRLRACKTPVLEHQNRCESHVGMFLFVCLLKPFWKKGGHVSTLLVC